MLKRYCCYVFIKEKSKQSTYLKSAESKALAWVHHSLIMPCDFAGFLSLDSVIEFMTFVRFINKKKY